MNFFEWTRRGSSEARSESVYRVCKWALLVISVSKLYLQVDLICQNRHLVSYRQVPGSIPDRDRINFFFFFSPIFVSFLTRFPFCSTRISKVAKCTAFQLWTLTYFYPKRNHYTILAIIGGKFKYSIIGMKMKIQNETFLAIFRRL